MIQTSITPAQEAMVTVTIPAAKLEKIATYALNAGGNVRYEVGGELYELLRAARVAKMAR